MQITKADLALVLYEEITDEISRGNNALISEKIAIGCGEVDSYLHRYDTNTIWGIEWQNAYFKQLCINVITWHLITIANPSINADVIRQNYEDAIKYLTNVQKGIVRPNWPLRPNDPDTNIDDAGNVQWASNRKRNNHY